MSYEKIVCEIQRKYSPKALLVFAVSVIAVAAIFFASIWGAAYYFSPPGGNVSVFWGLVQHTKGTLTPATSNLDTEFPLLRQVRLFSFESEKQAAALYPWQALPWDNPPKLTICPDVKGSGGRSACLDAKLESYEKNHKSSVGISLMMQADASLKSSEFAFVTANVFVKASEQLTKSHLKARFYGYRKANDKEEMLSGPDTDIIPGKWTLVPWCASGYIALGGKYTPLAPKSFDSLNLVVWSDGLFEDQIHFDDIQIYVQK